MERREALKTMSLGLGYTLTPAALTTLMTACTKEAKVDWVPKFFTVKEAYAVEQIAEVIFPKTDIPGAKDVGAHIFVDLFLADVVEKEKQEKVKKGAQQWVVQFESRLGKNLGAGEYSDFEQDVSMHFDLSSDEHKKVLKMLAEEVPGPDNKKYFIYHFLTEVRNLARVGFYASEEIGENVLSYLPVPGKYQGCIPLEEVGNTWSF